MDENGAFSGCVLRIPIKMKRTQKWEQWVLLSSDRHHDNPASNRALQKLHLEQAKERDALIFDFGDLFCAMQGKYDPRSNKADIRPEHQRPDYLDAIIDDAADFFAPYAPNIKVLGRGNHCLSILNRLETDLIQRLVNRLNNRGGNTLAGGYRGWIRLYFKQGSFTQTVNIYYTHGANSNAPVTKGILQTSRRAVWLPDADIIASGHIHESWAFPIYRSRLSQQDVEYIDKQLHIQLPTYKEEFFGKNSNFHHTNSRPPKPLGAWWVRFSFDDRFNRIKFQAMQAE